MRASLVVSCLVLALPLFAARDARANNWPPQRGADMSDPKNWPNDPAYPSMWQLWGWLPKQSNAPGPYVPDDVTLGASGFHADQAWTYSIGRDDVRIAVLDSGMQWDEADLLDKAWLNPGELKGAHKPQDKNGNACGGTGALVGYDCTGDGIFSVSDYRDDPRIAPVVAGDKCAPDPENPQQLGPDRIKGDVNHNCLLDAGDLIQLFSDGVDDDANGYTDDISGWDFYKNDNDPYDDTRYGHGTLQSKGSSAAGNNGIGGIGVCPACRFVNLRVGDSFIVDGADWAKAAVYATDTGVKVVQSAVGSIDDAAFTRAAIDYAYSKGTILVLSMADENSRHHNMPAMGNHTFPVHSLSLNGDINHDGPPPTSTATTYLAFSSCTNYGGNATVSVSEGCSSEATKHTGGAAGLLYSFARDKGMNPELRPEEAMQILKLTADDINVDGSGQADQNGIVHFYESKPGWDQRFGYGRMNLGSAMKAIDSGLIPPEVDLVSPLWFDVLYADRGPSPVPVVGRVAAMRAQSYDYRVEWAAGVEPDDKDFQALVDWVRNVPASQASGGAGSPLAMISPDSMDTSHAVDPDSKYGENDRTVTLRVLAVAHYANGDAKGEARRTIGIVNRHSDSKPANGLDTDLAQGFPMQLGASIESSPKLADIDGDNVRDIVVGSSDGTVHVFTMKSGSPAEAAGFPYKLAPLDGFDPKGTDPSVPSYLGSAAYQNGGKAGGIDPAIARESIVATPAIGDVNGDGKPEIVVASWSGTVYVVGSDGQALKGWPKRLPLVPSCPLDPSKPKPPACMDIRHGWARGAGASPVLADFDGDKKLEIVQAAFDGNVYVWHGDGTPLDGWPVALHSTKTINFNRILSTPAVADFNGDGVPDLVCGSNEQIGGDKDVVGGDRAGAGPVFLVDGRGMKAPGGNPYFANWPIRLTSLSIFPLVAQGVDSAPAITDFDGDGKPEALVEGNGTMPYVLPLDPGTQTSVSDPSNRIPVCIGSQTSTPSQPCFDPSSVFGDQSKAFRPDTMIPLFSSPSVGDLDQDGVPDFVVSGGSLSLAGQLVSGGSATPKPFQQLLAMWSGASGHMMPGSPVLIEDFVFLMNETIADITGDDYPEVMLGTGGYFVHAVDACGREAPSWPKFTNGWLIATPAVGDVDGDHKLEVVSGTREGNLFVWHTSGSDTGVVQWESFHHDNANTGFFDPKTPLDQGVYERGHALDWTKDCAPPGSGDNGGVQPGGCGCATIGSAGGGWTLAACVGGLLSLALVRRRRS